MFHNYHPFPAVQNKKAICTAQIAQTVGFISDRMLPCGHPLIRQSHTLYFIEYSLQ